MGLCDFSESSLSEKDEADLLPVDQNLEIHLQPPGAHVALAPDDGEPDRVNTVNVPPPPVYYVIVGFGPAAVMNHTTLRWSQWGRDRIGTLPVMHIGFANPWPSYVVHGMGQVPFLLTMPGFGRQPNTPPNGGPPPTSAGGLESRFFGNAIDEQLQYLQNNYNVHRRRAWVAWVQHKNNPASIPDIHDYYPENGPSQGGPGVAPLRPGAPANDPRWLANGVGTQLHAAINAHVQYINQRNDWPDEADYRIIAVGLNRDRVPQFETVYAAYIDFCTGPGRPNVLKPQNCTHETRQALHIARTHPWLAPQTWDQALRNRRILSGVDAIAQQVQWNQAERVCLTAGGGVGLNAAEKADEHHCYLDWFGRNALTDTFANPRNHTFLLDPVTHQPMQVGALDGHAPFYTARIHQFQPAPPDSFKRFGRQAALANVRLTAAGGPNPSVRVTLAANGNPVLTDHNQATQNLAGSGLTNNPVANDPPGQLWDCSAPYVQDAQQPPHPHPHAANWPSAEYDRLVIPNGQAPDALGQPTKFREIGPLQYEDVNGRATALTSEDKKVRLLGAACQVEPNFSLGNPNPWNWQTAGQSPRDRHWRYHSTLPVSAVPDGFILSGSNIATANRYFVNYPNTNINTMTLDEIVALLPVALPGRTPANLRTIAATIVGCRNRANGYPGFLDTPQREGLMTIVNQGQNTLFPPQPVPGNWAPSLNDGRVDGLWTLAPPLQLHPNDRQSFDAVFRYDYP